MIDSLAQSLFGPKAQATQAKPAAAKPRAAVARPFEPGRPLEPGRLAPQTGGERRTSPAVTVGLSRQALAFLNGEAEAGGQAPEAVQAARGAELPGAAFTAFMIDGGDAAPAQPMAAAARAPYGAAGTEPAAMLPPGSRVNIKV